MDFPDIPDSFQNSLDRLDAAAVLDILIIAGIIFALAGPARHHGVTLLRGGVAIVCVIFLLGRVWS